MPVTADNPAPYATSGAILDLINRYRSRGLPSPVDGEVLGRVGIAQTLIARTLQSLQTLDLIDAKTGVPTPTFETLRLAPEDEFKKRLEEWLKGSYADVFSIVDPAKDSEARIRDAFRTYRPVGQQERMVLLFQGLCAAAGLVANKPASSSPARSAAARPRSTVNQQTKRVIPKNPAKPSGALPPALAGLLESLPVEAGWTSAERDKFLTTFKAVLDYCIPVISREPEPVNEAAE